MADASRTGLYGSRCHLDSRESRALCGCFGTAAELALYQGCQHILTRNVRLASQPTEAHTRSVRPLRPNQRLASRPGSHRPGLAHRAYVRLLSASSVWQCSSIACNSTCSITYCYVMQRVVYTHTRRAVQEFPGTLVPRSLLFFVAKLLHKARRDNARGQGHYGNAHHG